MVEELFLSRDHVWRAGSQGSQQTWSCGIILRKAFKNSRQRGVYVTFESFVDHRRLQDSAVAGIHVNEGRLKDAYNYVSESGENISIEWCICNQPGNSGLDFPCLIR